MIQQFYTFLHVHQDTCTLKPFHLFTHPPHLPSGNYLYRMVFSVLGISEALANLKAVNLSP